MSRAQNKSIRLLEIESLLLAHPEGLSQAEIARRLGVNRSTINRYLPDLPGYVYIDDLDGDKWKIDRTADLVNIRLNLHEALAIHLAARLLAVRMDSMNPHSASALRKLALPLERLAPRISHHLLQSADVMDGENQRQDPVYLQALEKLTLAWAAQRKVQLWHRSERSGGVHQYLFCPYFIEPYAIGQTTFVIGHCDTLNARRTFKIERIERVEPTREPFELPAEFDPSSLLDNAWGIWYSETEPVEVVLRFSARVARRVQETRWHRSQILEPQPDGSLLWRARIAEPLEMLNWIRGWGADVEVLEPREVRETLRKEARIMVGMYGITNERAEDELIAHWRKSDEQAQSLVKHLEETAEIAAELSSKGGLSELGRIMGLLHDYGKASKEYQDYLKTNEGLINPDEDSYSQAKRGEIDHSTAGAQLVYEKLASRGQEGKILAQFLALAMASHHSGLIDCLKPDGKNEFQRRITKDDQNTHLIEARNKLPDIEKRLDEILAQPIEKQFFKKIFEESIELDRDSQSTLPFKHGLLARFLLSCLLDADRLNTADFEKPGNEAIRNYGKYISWDVLIERLEAKFTQFEQETALMQRGRALEVNQLRAQVAQVCLDTAKKPKGIYQLTVPTGGGKTLASLRFALHHAQAHKMDRVFYIVPYITIIDQNADKVREILEKENECGQVVLEHHSNFVPENDTRQRHNLLAENWDAPIVFTTQVQFLEALFSTGTRDARRMHQLANSIIILDEVQTVPIKIINMLNTALRFLVHDCNTTIVLCTATQPPLDNLPDNPYRALTIKAEQKIIQNEAELFEKLKRVEVHDERKPGGWENEEIADLAERALEDKGSALLVVNTRASAQALYQKINGRNLGVKIYHLSTNMCPAHRMDKLGEIKIILESNEPVICVSTQLIEAGVDIDFGAVIRSLAGLDSIAQSAGRCNRHGMREGLGSVWVVNPQEENLERLKDIKIGRDHAQRVLDDFSDNPDAFGSDRVGLKAVAAYFKFYFQSRQDEMDYPIGENSSAGRNDNLFNLLSLNKLSTQSYQATHHAAPEILLRQSFQSAAKEFHVIDSPTRGIVVPYKDGNEVINELCSAFRLEKQGKLLKQAQQYSVSLFNHQFDKLLKTKAIQEVQEGAGIYYLDEQYYSEKFGWSDEPVSDMTVHIVGS